jgi:hypothetical protein
MPLQQHRPCQAVTRSQHTSGMGLHTCAASSSCSQATAAASRGLMKGLARMACVLTTWSSSRTCKDTHAQLPAAAYVPAHAYLVSLDSMTGCQHIQNTDLKVCCTRASFLVWGCKHNCC